MRTLIAGLLLIACPSPVMAQDFPDSQPYKAKPIPREELDRGLRSDRDREIRQLENALQAIEEAVKALSAPGRKKQLPPKAASSTVGLPGGEAAPKVPDGFEPPTTRSELPKARKHVQELRAKIASLRTSKLKPPQIDIEADIKSGVAFHHRTDGCLVEKVEIDDGKFIVRPLKVVVVEGDVRQQLVLATCFLGDLEIRMDPSTVNSGDILSLTMPVQAFVVNDGQGDEVKIRMRVRPYADK